MEVHLSLSFSLEYDRITNYIYAKEISFIVESEGIKLVILAEMHYCWLVFFRVDNLLLIVCIFPRGWRNFWYRIFSFSSCIANDVNRTSARLLHMPFDWYIESNIGFHMRNITNKKLRNKNGNFQVEYTWNVHAIFSIFSVVLLY